MLTKPYIVFKYNNVMQLVMKSQNMLYIWRMEHIFPYS